MLGLHCVPGGHGTTAPSYRRQNGRDVTQPRGTEWVNVTRLDSRGCQNRFWGVQKFATAVTVRTRNVTGRRKENGSTQQYLTGRNRP